MADVICQAVLAVSLKEVSGPLGDSPAMDVETWGIAREQSKLMTEQMD